MNKRNLSFNKLSDANGANRILWHLVNHYSIEPLQAWQDYAVYRLGARIWDLRQEGWEIESITKEVKNRYGIIIRFAEYRLKSKVREDGSTFCSQCMKATIGTDHCGDHQN